MLLSLFASLKNKKYMNFEQILAQLLALEPEAKQLVADVISLFHKKQTAAATSVGTDTPAAEAQPS
jgi:hypothetical protein